MKTQKNANISTIDDPIFAVGMLINVVVISAMFYFSIPPFVWPW